MQQTYKRTSQVMFKKRINIRQMEKIVRLGARIEKTTFFFGGAGLGKSQKMQQIADSMYPHRIGNNLCDVRLSDKEPQDIAGIPVPVTYFDPVQQKEVTRTVYACPSFWPTDPDWEGIVFLDELPNAMLGTQHSAYQVILDHVAGDFRFPKGCVFTGAGNRDTDNAGTTEMPGPLVNRMVMCEVDYDLDVWIEDYAVPSRLHPIVIGFLKQFPEHFYTGDVENRSTPVFASPRQWKTVSDILFDHEREGDDYITEIAIAGSVGEGLETAVMAYYLRAAELPPLEDIFSGAVTKHELSREKNDLVYVLAQTCLRKLEDEVMDNALKDEDVIERAGNFLNFMYNNHYERNKDTLIALMIGIFRSSTEGKEPVLSMNPKRVKMTPLLRKNCPAVMQLVVEYQTRYGVIMKDFS